MRTYDFAPLHRSTVGFDRMFSLLDQASRAETAKTWPPYNIEKVSDDAYQITLAVAGFAPEEIDVTQNDTSLIVSGKKSDDASDHQFLHRGIAARHFRQSFSLADHVKVTGATMEHGLLTVNLVREVPEAFKPRRIPIGGSSAAIGQDNWQAPIEGEAKAA